MFSRLGVWVFWVVFAALVASEVVALFVRASGVPAADGRETRLVGEVAGDAAVTQTFTVEAAGFSGVTIAARPFGGAVTGDVVFTVSEIPGADKPAAGVPEGSAAVRREVARVISPAVDVVAAGRHRVSFAPIGDSSGRRYEIRIEVPDAAPGRGLALVATRDQAYQGGVLTVAGREQWADLVFAAHAERATVFRRLEHGLREYPAWIGSRATLVALFILYNWALGTFAWHLFFGEKGSHGFE